MTNRKTRRNRHVNAARYGNTQIGARRSDGICYPESGFVGNWAEDTRGVTKYRMYIDETGNTDLNHADDPNHRFLSLTGVIVDLEHIRETVHPEMESLKVRYFDSHPDEPVILHRKEMVNRKRPFLNLRDARVEHDFNQDLLKCLREWEYGVVTVCLDKKNHAETYGDWVRDPYHYCMEILLERFNFWLNRRGAKGDVMAESRGGGDDRRLKKRSATSGNSARTA